MCFICSLLRKWCRGSITGSRKITMPVHTHTSHRSLYITELPRHPFPLFSLYSFSQKYSNRFNACVVNGNMMWHSRIMTVTALVKSDSDEGRTFASSIILKSLPHSLSSELHYTVMVNFLFMQSCKWLGGSVHLHLATLCFLDNSRSRHCLLYLVWHFHCGPLWLVVQLCNR